MKPNKPKGIKGFKAWACVSGIKRDSIDGLWGLPANVSIMHGEAIVYMIYRTKKQAALATTYYSIDRIIPVLITPIPKKKVKK